MSSLRFIVAPAACVGAIAACVGDTPSLVTQPPVDAGVHDAEADHADAKQPALIDCGASPAGPCTASWQDRGFARTDLGEPFRALNVAIVHFQGTIYGALQGSTASVAGRTSYATWSPTSAPAPDAFFGHTLCGDDASCLGQLRLMAGEDVRAIYRPSARTTDGCMGARITRLDTPDVGISNRCTPAECGATFDAFAAKQTVLYGLCHSLRNQNMLFQEHLPTDYRNGVDLEPEFGLWGGVLPATSGATSFHTFGSINKRLTRVSPTANPNKFDRTDFGVMVQHPDVVVVGETAFVAGLLENNSYVVAAYNFADGSARPSKNVDLSALSLQKPPSVTLERRSDGSQTRPHRPILLRAGSNGLFNLVALSATAAGASSCNLYAAVQTRSAPTQWRKYTLRQNLPCADIAFDATLDTSNTMHVLHTAGVANENVGYAVIKP